MCQVQIVNFEFYMDKILVWQTICGWRHILSLYNCTQLNYALFVTGLIILQLAGTTYGNAAKR